MWQHRAKKTAPDRPGLAKVTLLSSQKKRAKKKKICGGGGGFIIEMSTLCAFSNLFPSFMGLSHVTFAPGLWRCLDRPPKG